MSLSINNKQNKGRGGKTRGTLDKIKEGF
jgi:hypothetical protein